MTSVRVRWSQGDEPTFCSGRVVLEHLRSYGLDIGRCWNDSNLHQHQRPEEVFEAAICPGGQSASVRRPAAVQALFKLRRHNSDCLAEVQLSHTKG